MSAPPALPLPLRKPLAFVAVLAALTVALLGMLYAREATPTAADAWSSDAAAKLPGSWHQIASVIDFAGEPVGATVLVAVLAVWCLKRGHRRVAALALFGSGATVISTTALKPLVGRTINGPNLAFPSGHTALATAVALIACLLVARGTPAVRAAGLLLPLTGVAGAAMAGAQVVLGSHYMTDTAGGFCTALVVVPVTARLIDHLADRHAPGLTAFRVRMSREGDHRGT